jgi:methionyl-tRNA formyltransferase
MNGIENKFVFFGSSEFSVYVLDTLKQNNFIPSLIVTTEDKPKGRKLLLTPNVVKVWAQENSIKIESPKSLKNNEELVQKLSLENADLFLVASYGKIIPKTIFDIPKSKTLNIHPSLLPKYRGASPIQSAILNDEQKMGVSIMQIEETMDTGPVLIQKEIEDLSVMEGREKIEKILAHEGALLFIKIYKDWNEGILTAQKQDDSNATYCKKIEKEDGLLDIEIQDFSKNAKANILKTRAFEGWPLTYFFINQKRIIIKKASYKDNKFIIERVLPEGKKEMDFEDFLRGIR